MLKRTQLSKFKVPNLTFLRQNHDDVKKPGKSAGAPEDLEAPTTCCMSGCANCVWLDYAEKLSNYYKDGGEKALKEINEKIEDPSLKAFLLHELRMRQKQEK